MVPRCKHNVSYLASNPTFVFLSRSTTLHLLGSFNGGPRNTELPRFQDTLLSQVSNPCHGIKLLMRWSHRHHCKCMHSLVNAHGMSDEMPLRDPTECNSTIRSYTASGRHAETVSVFEWMQSSGLRLNCLAFAAVIKSSAALLDAGLGRTFHGLAIKQGYAVDTAVEKALMDMHARFGALDDSCRVFEAMGRRDSVSWNVMLSGYSRAQLHLEAMELFHLMHACCEKDVKPTAITIAIILPICAKLRKLKLGRSIHAYEIKTGLESETLVGNALVSMYSKCSSMDDARRSFHLIACKDVVSWNSVITGYSENELFDDAIGLFCKMVLMSVQPNSATVASVLPICALVEHGWSYGKAIHCYALRLMLVTDLAVLNALLTHYWKIGDMEGAEFVFRKMHSRDVVTYNTMISGYAMNGQLSRALDLFHDMLSSGTKPDSITVVTVLPVCAQVLDIQEGRKIHDYVRQSDILSAGTSIGNALISFYGKCGKLDNAVEVFMGIPRRDVISWNAMLTAYADNGQWDDLIGLLNKMIHKKIQPDSITILSVLQACAFLGIRKVKEAHGYSFRACFISKLTVGNAIIDAYAKCGSLENAFRTFRSLTTKNVITGNTMIAGYMKHGSQEDAETVFEQMNERDLTTWNLMVQVYAQNDCTDQAFCLLRELQSEGMRPDAVSIVSILAACARPALVHLVRQCHGYKIRFSLNDLHLEGALLDSYSKCGSVNDACKLFGASPEKDLIMFTAMLGAYAMHGMAKEALGVFCQMLESGVKPDHVILTSLLSACSHAGLVEEGWNLFKSINEIHGMEPTMEHHACMVDLLARRGRLREAYSFIMDMPCEPNANVWGALLGACKTHGEVEIGRLVANRLFDDEATNIGNYVVMSNIYAADGRWDGVEQVRRLMKTKDVNKPAGCSWIEVERKRHVFVAGDFSHPNLHFIYKMLRLLDQQIKEPLVGRTCAKSLTRQ